MAYHEVITIMKNQAPVFDLDPEAIYLETLNLSGICSLLKLQVSEKDQVLMLKLF